MPYRWTLVNQSDLSSEVLTRDPVDWDAGIYTIKRSEKYKGAFHEYSTGVKFHCDGGGKEFIDNIYQTEDIDGRINILVEYDCDGSGVYDTLFTGIIDLSSYKTNRKFTTVQIEKSDLLTKLFSRDEISVDVAQNVYPGVATSIGGEAITPIDSIDVPMHSTEIEFISEWVIEAGYQYQSIENYAGIYAGWNAFFTHLAAINSNDFDTTISWTEFDTLGSTKDVVSIQASNIQPIMEFNTAGINTPQQVTWEIDFNGTFTDNQTIVGGQRSATIYKLNLYYGKKVSGVVMNIATIYDGPGDGGGGYVADPFTENFSIQKSGTITLNPGDEVYLAWYISYDTLTASNTIDATWIYDRSTFKIIGITTYKETTAKSVLVHEAFNQVVDSIADSDGNFYSEFYGRSDSEKQSYSDDGCGSLVAITNGLSIREFTGKPIFCSFKELFDVMDALHNIGAGIVSGKVRVEPLNYWFDKTTKIISLQKVNGVEISNDNRRYINKVDVGFQKWESEFRGGLDDVNAKQEYSTKIASVKNIYTKLASYIASTYTIEFTRRKNIQILPTEDWRYDNNNFLIALRRDAYLNFTPELYADSFSSGTGMAALNTAYNLRFTPKRMLLAHLNAITAGMQTIHGDISFVKGEGNTEFSSAKTGVGCQEDYSGNVIAENESIAWNDADAANISPIWLPEIYSFEYPLTYNEFKTIKNNPYGYIEFWEKAGDIKNGFILNMEYAMKTGKTKFELLKANV